MKPEETDGGNKLSNSHVVSFSKWLNNSNMITIVTLPVTQSCWLVVRLAFCPLLGSCGDTCSSTSISVKVVCI